MSEKSTRLEVDLENEYILEALRNAGKRAAREYFFAGQKLVGWKDGHVVDIDPVDVDPTLKNFNREQSA